MRIDLHTHTTASDGLHAPAELVRLCVEHGVEVVAPTDHDTTAGFAEARAAGELAGVRVVPGIELSSREEGRNVHVLGYLLDPGHAPLREALERMRTERDRRARAMVERLNELGYELTWEEVAAQASGEVVARPHVARALVARGHVPDVRSAFTPALIADGGRADVPRSLPSPAEAVELIRAAGGVAVWAHPALAHHAGPQTGAGEDLLERLVAAGLAGLEADHPEQPAGARDRLRALARRHGLVTTGGSDFHGREGYAPGAEVTDPEAFSRLEELARGGS